MTGFQIVTARSFNRLTRTLRAPGIRHKSPLVAMIESIGNREADIYVLTLRNRITGDFEEVTPIGMPAVKRCYQLFVTIRLQPGVWRLELESVRDGLLAWRDVEVFE